MKTLEFIWDVMVITGFILATIGGISYAVNMPDAKFMLIFFGSLIVAVITAGVKARQSKHKEDK